MATSKAKPITPARLDRAAYRADWQQVALNGGPPCFFLEEHDRFCLRAERWPGHEVGHQHGYVRRLLAERCGLLAERDGLRGALTECERVLDDCRRAFDIRADANIIADAAADVRHILTALRALTPAPAPGSTGTP